MRSSALTFATLLAFSACDDDNTTKPDATSADTTDATSTDTTTAPDSVEPDSVEPTEVAPDVGPDAEPDVEPDVTPDPYTKPMAIPVPLSPNGPDQLQAAAPGPNGTFYLVGFAAQGVASTDARTVLVIQTGPMGPVATFGTANGTALTSLDFKGGNDELDIVVQPSGKIVILATVQHAATLDTDIALLRLDANGTLDTEFGDEGIRVFSLADAIIDGTTVTGNDRSRGLAVDATGRLYVHAVRRGDGDFNGSPRTDTDYSVTRFSVDGDRDLTFAGDGEYVLDLRGSAPNNTPSNATARGIHVLADGAILGTGYSTTEGLGPNPQPVLFKLDSTGAPIAGFAAAGVFHDGVLSAQTEVYNVAIHGTHFVTGGYGRESGDQNDWVSLRFDLATGDRDLDWGDEDNGAVVFDPSGTAVGDNLRNVIGLPDGKTLFVGSAGPNNQAAQDAVFAVLDADGELDTTYGTGIEIYALGAESNDQFWGGAVSGDNAIIVGYRGGGPAADQTTTKNDDSYVVVLPLRD